MSGFAQHVDVDLTLPDSTTVHFTGDVQLNSGTTNTETGIVGISNLYVFPKVTGSFANTSGTSLTLATAQVEVFLDRALANDCILNVDATPCDDAIIRGTLGTDAPTTLEPGKTYDLPTDTKLSTITVPDADALSGASVAPVISGAAVTGYAVIVAAPTADKIATVIFDRNGKQVVSCPALPVDCMDADRSVLNG
ncbi:MAG: hypothetical protein JWL72_2806 [Ilumatobacteraceae bacterium]|nr:hypothetical protein [Ilumatobacteraceae bacterium]